MTNTIAQTAIIEKAVEIGQSITVGAYTVILAQTDECLPQTRVCDNARIGANVTIRPGVTIGRSAQIYPGCVVTRCVPPLAVVDGFPAQVIGYQTTSSEITLERQKIRQPFDVQGTGIDRVTRYHLDLIHDPRGNLVPGEFESLLPFEPKRFFLVMDVPSSEIRGEHAHLRCEQFLIAVKGSVSVIADDGWRRQEFLLNTPNVGLFIPTMIWGTQYKYSRDCVLLAFASEKYDASDYIRSYDVFLERCAVQKTGEEVFIPPVTPHSAQICSSEIL